MIIQIRGLKILIVSNRLVNILSNHTHPMTNQWINHENIHLRQIIESLGIFWILSMFEYIYFRIVKKYSHFEAYKLEAIEQEAYLNQNNENYLSTRSIFSTIKYFKRKTQFDINSDHQVIVK